MTTRDELIEVIGNAVPDPEYSGARIRHTCEPFEIKAIADALLERFCVRDHIYYASRTNVKSNECDWCGRAREEGSNG